MNLSDILMHLLASFGPSKAQAEIIPQDPEAADLLNQARQSFGGTLQAAQQDPRQVNVYAGPRTEWMARTNAAGVYKANPGELGTTGYHTTLPNTVYVGPESDPLAPSDPKSGWNMEWLGHQIGPNFDPQWVHLQTLTHELGHFLTRGHARDIHDSETLADLIAANPTLPELQALQHKGVLKDADQAARILQMILGQHSKTFMGPEQQVPLRFEYKPPTKARHK